MRKILILILSLSVSFIHQSTAQALNWSNLQPSQKHMMEIGLAWDYGTSYHLGYSYQIKQADIPILLHASLSVPAGDELLDDLKTKLGLNLNYQLSNNWHSNFALYGLYRRYENPLATLNNFGVEVKATIGLYKKSYFLAADLGFDKAIVSHFQHSSIFKEHIYSGVQDGWYDPATGGNLYYGLQLGLSWAKSDLIFKLGKIRAETFDSSPTIPFYSELGYQFRF